MLKFSSKDDAICELKMVTPVSDRLEFPYKEHVMTDVNGNVIKKWKCRERLVNGHHWSEPTIAYYLKLCEAIDFYNKTEEEQTKAIKQSVESLIEQTEVAVPKKRRSAKTSVSSVLYQE